MSVGAGSELRQWPTHYWVELLKRLGAAHNPIFVFFGGGGDKAETQAIIAQMPPENCIDLTDSTSLVQLSAYMKRLDSYIGCDTGLTHMAGKLGLPTLNIFAGISNVSAWRARGAKVKTVYAEVICAPCHLRFEKDCPNNNVCMNAIIPGIVYDCFEKLVGKAAAAS